MEIQPGDRPRHGSEVVWRAGDEEIVLLKPDDGRYFALDPVGGRIWTLCDGERSAAQIADLLVEEYDADADAIRADVMDLLADLADERLVEIV